MEKMDDQQRAKKIAAAKKKKLLILLFILIGIIYLFVRVIPAVVTTGLVGLLTLFYFYVQWKFTYWRRMGG